MPDLVSTIRNLGPASDAAFTKAGITTAAQRRKIGADWSNFVEKLFLDRGTKIEARTADLILLASGRIGDVGTEAGSTGSAVL